MNSTRFHRHSVSRSFKIPKKAPVIYGVTHIDTDISFDSEISFDLEEPVVQSDLETITYTLV